MNKVKPIIGVTGPVKGGTMAWWFTAFAVWLQGGRPVRIYPGKDISNFKLDGLILGGGADISPERYDELLAENAESKPEPTGTRGLVIRIVTILIYPVLFVMRYLFSAKSTGTDVARDELEFDLLVDACENHIPVLGICRGAQLINVKFGGSLHQNINSFYTEVPKLHTIRPRKTIVIEKSSRLHQITGASRALVNALHNQAVDQLGDELKITAKEENGVVQGIEHPGYEYLLGVQWHPEYMPQIPLQRRIFRELVQKAAGK